MPRALEIPDPVDDGGGGGGAVAELVEWRSINIHAAVQRNDEVTIKNYAASGGDLEARDKDALAPLHVAAAGGFTNVVEFLAKNGCR